ncbi:MAG TPA: methyltransferase, partial [Clostridiaceae bacterium]|nr:methyltransferase [Clostridiaceae bacterium]
MDEEKNLSVDESIEDLQLEGLKIIQKKKGFRFGVDAVLLSDFAKVRNRDRVMDFCTGTGILPILIAGKSKAHEIYGLEIQEEFTEMAKRSIRMNHLEERVTIVSGDLCDREGLKGLGL